MQTNDLPKLSVAPLDDADRRYLEWYVSNYRTGALHTAITRIGEQYGHTTKLCLEEHGIYSDGSLEEDLQALEALGLPMSIFALEPGWFTKQYTQRANFATLLIMAASTILLRSFAGAQVAQAPSRVVPEPSAGETYDRLTLALVLKGAELADIQLGNQLSVEQVIDMLDRASYFACMTQRTMESIFQQLTLEVGEMDRTSKQPVLVAIQFEHNLSVPQDKKLETKLQLRRFLRQGSNQFQLKTIRKVRVGNLTEFGFVRT
jgi:hypothetical protein